MRDDAAGPVFLWVSLPVEDDDFREHVADALDLLGRDVHRQPSGPAGLLLELADAYPAAGLVPVVMAAQGRGARQVWWYVHRDGAPPAVA